MKSVVLRRFEHAWEARIAKGRLAAEGIEATLRSEHHCTANWTLVFALGFIELRVPESEAAAAKTVLDECDSGVFEKELDPDGTETEKTVCGNCDSTDIERMRNLRTKEFWANMMSFVLFGIFWPSKCWIERCRRCGRTAAM